MIRPFKVQDGIDIVGEQAKDEANLNAIAGPGYTLVDKGKPVACGGVRIYGVGDAWFAMKDSAPKIELVRESKKWLNEITKENNLWEVFAWPNLKDMDKARRFLKHMGFVPTEAFVR